MHARHKWEYTPCRTGHARCSPNNVLNVTMLNANSMGSGASEHDAGANSCPRPTTHSPICTKSCWHLGVCLHDADPPVTNMHL